MDQGQLNTVAYNPNHLIDALIRHLGLQSDGALSRKLKVAKNVIKNIRHGHIPIGASMLMWMHEATGISINELRVLMGDRRSKFRLNVARIN
jgi:plasmid maintenance system antidote protein VapI